MWKTKSEPVSSGARLGVRVTSMLDPPHPDDGYRVLVDATWPRGLARAAAELDAWMAAVAPSLALRRRLGGDPGAFTEFRRCYLAELREPPRARAVSALRLIARRRPVSLLTAAPVLRCSPAAIIAERLTCVLAPAAGAGPH